MVELYKAAQCIGGVGKLYGDYVSQSESERYVPIHVYKTRHVMHSLQSNLLPPEPVFADADVIKKSKEQKLRDGDVLIPMAYKTFGSGTFRDDYPNSYAGGKTLIIRADDELTRRYLSIFFRSEVGKDKIASISKQTKSFEMQVIKISDLRKIDIPELADRDYMLEAVQEESKLHPIVEVGVPKFISKSMQEIVKKFMYLVKDTTIVSSLDDVQVCAGREHTVVVTESGVHIVENKVTKGLLVFRDDEIMVADGITHRDVAKFEEVAEIAEAIASSNEPEYQKEEIDLG